MPTTLPMPMPARTGLPGLAGVASTWSPIDRGQGQAALSGSAPRPLTASDRGTGIQQLGNRQSIQEPGRISQIPVTTLPGSQLAYQSSPPTTHSTSMRPRGGRADDPPGKTEPEVLPKPRTPSSLPDPKTTEKPAATHSGPAMVDVGPVAPLYPPHGSAVAYAPTACGTTPITDAFMHLKQKFYAMQTAQPIKDAPPVPRDAPREFEKRSLPPYIIEPPDVLLIESTAGLKDQPIILEHRVRPDGTVGLGIYGQVYVAGMTLDEAKCAIIKVLSSRLKEVSERNTNVDIIGYNSKKYYVITDGGGYGEQVFPFPITGNETVLDALANINGLPAVASKKNIWVARATPDGAPYPRVMPVDWKGIAQYGSAATNFQILPNDRIYVKADHLISVDTKLARILSPIERILGTTLLGTAVVNSIRNGGRSNNNSGSNNFVNP